MKKVLALFFFFFGFFPVFAQDEFHFVKPVQQLSIPFKCINNLIFIPIKVNGIELNFLLDSGVEETILFSLEDKKEVNFFNVEKISLRGLGSEESIEGLKSTHNVLETHGLKSENHLLYVVLDQDFNLSSHVGIPVNGIIGYNFLKSNLIEINYSKRKIIVRESNPANLKRLEGKFTPIPISIEKAKPYLMAKVNLEGQDLESKLLVDIGNSDAVWLFEHLSKQIRVPSKQFEDYLGKGFSGDVMGKRARMAQFSMQGFSFKNPIVSFPDSSSIQNVKMVPGRIGSVGAEILKRFTLVFDYANSQLYLKKNKDFDSPFKYNKSGIEVQHYGLQWVQETVKLETIPLAEKGYQDPNAITVSNNFRYKFQLKPVYQIANVRANSPAAKAGLQKGDILISINKNRSYKYSLQEINELLKPEDDRWLSLEVERESQLLKFRFELLDVL